MTRHWLYSRFGINFVAGGLVASIFACLVVVVQDAVLLVTGVWPKLPLHREIEILAFAGVASVFWTVTTFIFRPGWPKFASGALAISFGSYVVQPFVPIPPAQLTAFCIARVLAMCTPLLFLARAYFADHKVRRPVR